MTPVVSAVIVAATFFFLVADPGKRRMWQSEHVFSGGLLLCHLGHLLTFLSSHHMMHASMFFFPSVIT